LAIGLCCFTGCTKSDAPRTAPVEGIVTLNGKPLPNIGVVFFPLGSGPIASGNTDEQGIFSLTTVKPNDGASVGEHRVAFGAAEEGEKEYASNVLPPRYGSPETSTFSVEVVDGTNNRFEFDLTR
jgi:hypothetical protein